ncbi:DUF3102 domain-containing protein [Marinicrinis sediminis]|uniref:DUF3102 domain-containing protein n=1 Tax=Marinicrinis sediminis TaxID=1652465 RepID=A0ABW5RCK8_9BACL
MKIVALSSDLDVVTAEINAYKRIAGESIFEIGRRLKHVKENDLTHVDFGDWAESIGFNKSHVHRYIQAFEQFSESPTSANLPSSKILEMLSLPSDVDRESFVSTSHTIPSTGAAKTVDEMTVRELREVKKALKEAEERAEKAEVRESDKLRRYVKKYGDIDDPTFRIDNSTEVNGAAMSFSEDVRNLLQTYYHLTLYLAEFTTINRYSLDEYKSAVAGLKEFITALERNLSFSETEEAVIIDIH